MIKTICFSLWGNNPKYTIGAIKNAELSKIIYPDWKCKFYVGNDVPNDIINKLQELDCYIENMNYSGWNGMFWRFFGADSDDIFLSRDTDSRLNYREKAAVEQWLASDKDFHIMRDHPYHKIEILGGMWGCRNGILKGLSDMISNYQRGDLDNKYQVDQIFLKEIVYPIVKDRSIVHDEIFEQISFPSYAPPRTRSYFVGQVYNEHDEPQFN